MTLALVIMGQSRPWSDRYLFLAFSGFQRGRYHRGENTLTYYAQLPSEPPLKGGRRIASGVESLGLKRSVRVQAFTCHS